ncbi:hypothetical protein N8972_00025 [Sulfurospirillum sp.]|nr:hypothetical protein [Sulfurospirillum sp.]
MQIKYSSAYCLDCKKNVKAEKSIKGVNHILHLILSLVTLGVWVIVWFFISMGNITIGGDKLKGFTCSECGSHNISVTTLNNDKLKQKDDDDNSKIIGYIVIAVVILIIYIISGT